MKQKKGLGLNELMSALLIVVAVGALVIISLVIFSAMNFPGTERMVIANESMGTVTSIEYVNAAQTNCSFGNFVLTNLINTTSGGVVPATNYTSASTGLITMTGAPYNNTALSSSYTYTWGSEACDASSNLVTQFAAYPALVGLVGTIVFLAAVIGILVFSFIMRGGRKA